MENLFADVPMNLSGELTTILAQSQQVRIERIVSHGHASAQDHWYDQEEHEWVLVLRGEATLQFEQDKSVHLKPGDHLLIPAHQKHRVQWTTPTEPTVWLAVFYRDHPTPRPEEVVQF